METPVPSTFKSYTNKKREWPQSQKIILKKMAPLKLMTMKDGYKASNYKRHAIYSIGFAFVFKKLSWF